MTIKRAAISVQWTMHYNQVRDHHRTITPIVLGHGHVRPTASQCFLVVLHARACAEPLVAPHRHRLLAQDSFMRLSTACAQMHNARKKLTDVH